MATVVVKTVKPSGGDYTSLAAAEAGEQRDLVAADEVAQIDCYAMLDTAQVVVSGWTTDSTHHIYVHVPISERHDGTRGVDSYRLAYASDTTMRIQQNNVYLNGLAISSASTGISCTSGFVNDDIRMSNLLFYDCAGWTIADHGSGTRYMDNCIIVNGASYGINHFDGSLLLDNCVIANCGDMGIHVSSGTIQARNTYSGGNTSTDFFGVTTTTCFSSDGSSGSTVAPYSTATFVNVTTGSEDLHLVAGSALIDAGTDLSADPDWLDPDGAVDIEGTARPQGSAWDIGPYEYVSTGPEPVFVTSADDASMAEISLISALSSDTDISTGTEGVVTLSVSSTVQDKILSEESNIISASILNLFDSIEGLDIGHVGLTHIGTDSGEFVDAEFAGAFLTGQDGLELADAVQSLSARLSASQGVTGLDAQTLLSMLQASDAAIGLDEATAIHGIFIDKFGRPYLLSAEISSGKITDTVIKSGFMKSGGI